MSKLIALGILRRYEEAVACGMEAHDTLLAYSDELGAGKVEQNLGGGNNVQGNSEPLQCYNIRCDSGPPPPLDQMAPETVLWSTPFNPSTGTSATLSFSGFDNATGVHFECRPNPVATAFSDRVSPMC
ncbi:MAG: hypothetical protein OHK0015_21020 [Chloroflexi bacterium OHK40]